LEVLEIVKGLREEREQIQEAIIALERLQASGGKRRRGRPPAWLAVIKMTAPKRRGRPPKSTN
jgi:hypothetical protein